LIDASKHIELHHDSDDIKEAFAQEYASFNRGVIAEVVKEKKQEQKKKQKQQQKQKKKPNKKKQNKKLFSL